MFQVSIVLHLRIQELINNFRPFVALLSAQVRDVRSHDLHANQARFLLRLVQRSHPIAVH